MITLTVTSDTVLGTDITIEGTLATDASFAAPSRATSIWKAPDGFPTEERAYRLTDNGVSIKRTTVQPVMLPLSSLGKIAIACEEDLSFAPLISAHPVSVSKASSASGTFACSYASELALSTNKWQYAAWNTDHYNSWADVPTPSVAEVTTDGVTVSTLSFTAGSGVYLNKTKFRLTLTNSKGSATSNEAVLTVT